MLHVLDLSCAKRSKDGPASTEYAQGQDSGQVLPTPERSAAVSAGPTPRSARGEQVKREVSPPHAATGCSRIAQAANYLAICLWLQMPKFEIPISNELGYLRRAKVHTSQFLYMHIHACVYECTHTQSIFVVGRW